MNVFIDSNVFLSFYHFASDDLEELGKLIDSIDKNEIRLYITKQVIDEVKRNRDNKIFDALKKFREEISLETLPWICRHYPEYAEIVETKKKLKKLKSELEKKLSIDIDKKTLKADRIIGLLFGKSILLDSSIFLEQAKNRYCFGNPPGKRESYGDAINWETLLGNIQEGEDLFLISDDKDFKSQINTEKLNPFLEQEWQERKKSNILFYTQLSEFFRKHHDDIKLKYEEEKDKAIRTLALSHNFTQTHYAIRELSKFSDFSNTQIAFLIDAAISNSQIAWIAQDTDVHDFYRNILIRKEHIFDVDKISAIRHLFGEGVFSAPNIDEEMPF